MKNHHSVSGPRTATGPTRSRDAAASKQALLSAAQTLFGQRGFESTTTRDIGDLAGVDAALIARYFGGKADLYIAAVVAEAQGDWPPRDFEGFEAVVMAVISRTDELGLGPVTQALIRSDTSDEIRAAAQAHMDRRLVVPMAAEMTRQGADRPRLRSEVVAAAVMGINLGRALGWFDALKTVPKEELIEIVTALLDGAPGPPRLVERRVDT
jgi:AcrR family transcriptional regulator